MGCLKRKEGYSVKGEDTKSGSDGEIVMKKQINLLQGVSIIVGIIIGSGIFVSPVGILQNVNSVGMSFILWIVCGIYNLLGAVCYAELGSSIPQSGGEYVYIRRAFGDMASFVCLWIDFLLICPVGIAAMGLMFAVYLLKPIYPDCDIPDLPTKLLAALITSKQQFFLSNQLPKKLIRLQALGHTFCKTNVGKEEKASVGKMNFGQVEPFPKQALVFRVCSSSLLKMLFEKDKLLVTSTFSFSRSVYTHLENFSAISIKFENVACKLFLLGSI